MERYEIFRKRWVTGMRGGWVGKRAAAAGRKQEISHMSKVCCRWLTTGQGGSHCATTNWEFRGHRILFTFSIQNVTYALHHLWHPHSERMKVVFNFKRKAAKQNGTGTVAFLPQPQTKIKAFHAEYLYSRLSSLRGVWEGTLHNPVASVCSELWGDRVGVNRIPSSSCFHLLEVDCKTKATFTELKAFHTEGAFRWRTYTMS